MSAGTRKAPVKSVAGYSGTPLARKLGIAEGSRVRLVGGPTGYRDLLAPMPAGVRFVRTVDERTDVVHQFVRERTDLAVALPVLRKAIRADAAVWISWPKRASGVATDVTEDVIREVALPLGFVDVKVCAVDATWSALKLVIRRSAR